MKFYLCQQYFYTATPNFPAVPFATYITYSTTQHLSPLIINHSLITSYSLGKPIAGSQFLGGGGALLKNLAKERFLSKKIVKNVLLDNEEY